MALNLTGCELITNLGLAGILYAPLEELELCGCEKVSDTGLRSVIFGKPLRRLDLSHCTRLTEGVFSTLKSLPLEVLCLSKYPIFDAALKAFEGSLCSIRCT